MEIKVNGVTLYYEKRGTGIPLIMVHGNGETHQIFDRAIPLLEKTCTVYAIDTRGHGKSSSVNEFHYDDMAQDIKCFISALHLERPVFYGFSDGGIIGILLAASYPELFSSMIISGANLTTEGIRNGWMRLFRWIQNHVHDPKMEMMLKEPNIPLKMLHQINIPVTVLAGGRDMIKRSHTKEIAANIKGSRLKILWPYGHGGYIVHKKKIAFLILDAIQQNLICKEN